MTVQTNTNLSQIVTEATALSNTDPVTVYEPGNSKRDVVHTIVLHNSTGSSETVEVYFRSYKSGSAVDYQMWRFSVNGHATEQIDASIALNTYQSNKDAIRVVGDAGINVLVTVASGAGQ